MKRIMIISLLAIMVMAWACSPKDTVPDIIVDEEEKQAIQLLLGKWKYVYDYSQTYFERSIYYANRPTFLTITEADILWQNEKKQEEYQNYKFIFAGIGKVTPNRRENNKIDAYFYASYKTKLDLRIPAATFIYLSQPDTLRIDSFLDGYTLFVKEK